MEINYFDLVAASIILLLGLKGIINGFFKEVFGLLGIVGGIFIASRVGESVGAHLNAILNLSSPAAISFMGFLVTLASFWILMVFIGYLFKKLSSLSGLGPVEKILGFVFGASKFFLITAVIANAAYNVNALRPTVNSVMSNSVLFPVLVETGGFIMKIDPVGISNDINATIQKGTEAVQSKTQDIIDNTMQKKIIEIQRQVQEK